MALITQFAQPGMYVARGMAEARENRLAMAAEEAERATEESQQRLRQQAFQSLGTEGGNPQAAVSALAAAGDLEGARFANTVLAARQTAQQRNEDRLNIVFTNAALRAAQSPEQFDRTASAISDQYGIPIEQARVRLRQTLETSAPQARYEQIAPGDPAYPRGGRGMYHRNSLTGQVTAIGNTASNPLADAVAALASGRGEQNISERIVPPDVVARFGQDPNGVYVYERDARGQASIVRVDNPEARRVSLTGSPIGAGESVPVYTFGANLSDVYSLVESRPASEFGTPGGLQALAQSIGQQVLGFAGMSVGGLIGQARGDAVAMGVSERFAEEVFNPTLTEVQQTLRLLAFSAAAAVGGVEGRTLTDRKLDEFIQAVGDPLAPLNSRNAVLARLRQLDRLIINDLNAVRRDRGIDPIPRGLSWLDGSLQQWDQTGVTPDLRPNGGAGGAAQSAPVSAPLPRRSDFENPADWLEAIEAAAANG
jgi:hypothetical protein